MVNVPVTPFADTVPTDGTVMSLLINVNWANALVVPIGPLNEIFPAPEFNVKAPPVDPPPFNDPVMTILPPPEARVTLFLAMATTLPFNWIVLPFVVMFPPAEIVPAV